MTKKNHLPLTLVILTNITISCITQAFYALMTMDSEISIFHLSSVPLIIFSLNLILWFSRFRITFYLHWVCAYIGFFCSFFVFYFIHYTDLDMSNWIDFPPGEAYWDLFLFSIINSALQVIILFFLHILAYIIYRVGCTLISSLGKPRMTN